VESSRAEFHAGSKQAYIHIKSVVEKHTNFVVKYFNVHVLFAWQ
jgi:hypothetical protein